MFDHLSGHRSASVRSPGAEQRLESVERSVAEVQLVIENLVTQNSTLQEELTTLCDAICIAGLLSKVEIQRQQQARRRSTMLQSVLQSPALALAVGSMLGITTLRRLAEVSSTHGGQEIRAVLPAIARLYVPEVYLCGGGDGPVMATAERLSLAEEQERWTALPAMPTARSGCAGATVGGLVYVFGGYDGRQPVNCAECFDPISAVWEKLPPMRRVHFGCAAAAWAGKLYVFGGYDGRYALSASEVYEPSSGRWDWLPQMPTARARCAAASARGKLYVFGGHNGGTGLATAEVFDTNARDSPWSALPPMQVARQGCAAAAAKGKVYVVGGNSDGWQLLAVVEVFNPSTGTWDMTHPMPTARTRCAAVVVAGRIYVLGGFRAGHMLKTVEALDLETSTWETCASLPAPRCDCAAAVLPP